MLIRDGRRSVVYTETGTGRRVEGVEPYLELVKGWKEAVPDVSGTIFNTIAGGDLRFNGDRAEEIHHYLDVLALLEQVGAAG